MKSHRFIDEFWYESLGLRQVTAVVFLVAVHALRVLLELRVLHEVRLRAHVRIRLRLLHRIRLRLCHLSRALRRLWADEVGGRRCRLVTAKASDVVPGELCRDPLRVETSIR